MKHDTITFANELGLALAPLLLALRSAGFFESHVFLPLMTLLSVFIFFGVKRAADANGTFDAPMRKKFRYVWLAFYFLLCFVATNATAFAFKAMIVEEMGYTEPSWYIPLVSHLHFLIASVAIAYIYLVRTNRVTLLSQLLCAYIQAGFLGLYAIAGNQMLTEEWVLSDPTSGLGGVYMFIFFGILNFDIALRFLQPLDECMSGRVEVTNSSSK